MPSIMDVAKRAGVSAATVSKVLNNYPRISVVTRNKVHLAVDELNYKPNVVARSLVKRRSWTIGIFLHNVVSNPFVAELLDGMTKALENSGYDLIYLSMNLEDPNYSFMKHCNSRNVDGIVVFGVDKDNPQLQQLIHEDIPAMLVEIDLLGRRAGYITADNRSGIMLAIEHLCGLGHEKIAFITGDVNYIAGRDRLDGYRQGLSRHGLPYAEAYVEYSNFQVDGGYDCMARLLALPDAPTAVVCTADMTAIGAMHAAQDAGLHVPDDLSIVGFDNTSYSEIVRPRLTTVNQNIDAMGARAVEQLLAMIADPQLAPPVLTEPVDLVIRESTGAPRGRG